MDRVSGPPIFTTPCNMKLHFRQNSIFVLNTDEGLTLETSAFESLYGGQFTLSTQLIKPNYLTVFYATLYNMTSNCVDFVFKLFNIVHGTFCFSNSISRSWHAKLTIFSCCIKKNDNYPSFDSRRFVFNIQVHVFGFVRHRSAIH